MEQREDRDREKRDKMEPSSKFEVENKEHGHLPLSFLKALRFS